jgi:hypothetical protein
VALKFAASFDAGSGSTIADDSGGGHPLSVVSGSYTGSGHTNAGFSNTANTATTGASGTVPSITGTTCTVMAWVNPSTVATGGIHLICGALDSAGSTNFAIWTERSDFGTSNVLQGNVRIGGLVAINGSALTASVWTHIALTFDGTNIKLFKDGTLVATVSNTGTISNGTTFYIAGHNASGTGAVTVDDVRYFDTDESANISTWMSTPVTGSGGTTVNASAALAETVALSATATPTHVATSGLSETATLAATATPTHFVSASLLETATLVGTSGSAVNATAALSESATVTAAATVGKVASASLSETSSLAGTAKRTAVMTAALVESTTLAATPNATYLVTGGFSGNLSFTADLNQTTPPPPNVYPYIPPTPPNAVAVDEWRAFIFDTVSGTYDTELPLSDIPTYTYTLNDAGSGSVSIFLGGPDGFDKNLLDQYTENEGWRWSIAVVYNNSILQAGPITGENYTEGPTTTLNFVGIWKIFSKRVVINPSADISNPTDPSTNSTYTSVTWKQLAKLLVRDNLISQGNLPIDLPDDDAMAGTVTQTYFGYDLNLVSDELTNLTTMDQGPEIEFRPYWLDTLHVRWVMRVGSPRLGQIGSDWVYDYGQQGALVGIDKTSDSSNSTFGSYTRGSGSQDTQVIGFADDLALPNIGYPLLLSVDGNHSQETDPQVLDSYATANVNTYKAPVVSYTLTVKMNATDIHKQPTGSPRIDLMSVGDTLQADVTDHHRLPDGIYTVRVISVQNNDAQTAKLTTQTTS